jgi:3-dehydroquinate synthase
LFFNNSVPDKLRISLGERSYDIQFGAGLAALVNACFPDAGKGAENEAVVIDDSLPRLQGAALDAALGKIPRFVLPAGERAKSLESFGRILDFMAGRSLGRGGRLWVVGGGVTGDLGGFAAASYLRGIGYVQVPTTLLAMVDSSVGGKTGLNLAAGKNLVGAFHHPRAVLVATDFLATLPPREFAAGMAEVIKYGLLGDAALFDQLVRRPVTPQSAGLGDIIRRCCEMKARIVEADERETAPQGGRALLNLGHTFGHAIEQVTGYASYLHGEAVAIGLVAAARLSAKLGLVPPDITDRVAAVLSAHALPVRLRDPLPEKALLAAMQHDKKVRSGRLRFIVLRQAGEAATRDDVDPALVSAVWREMGAA